MTIDGVSVLACIKLGHSSFYAICEQLNARTFTAQKMVRNALQSLRKAGKIAYPKDKGRPTNWHLMSITPPK